jgi:hypothetical protein
MPETRPRSFGDAQGHARTRTVVGASAGAGIAASLERLAANVGDATRAAAKKAYPEIQELTGSSEFSGLTTGTSGETMATFTIPALGKWQLLVLDAYAEFSAPTGGVDHIIPMDVRFRLAGTSDLLGRTSQRLLIPAGGAALALPQPIGMHTFDDEDLFDVEIQFSSPASDGSTSGVDGYVTYRADWIRPVSF